jgi:hypothetical protein
MGGTWGWGGEVVQCDLLSYASVLAFRLQGCPQCRSWLGDVGGGVNTRLCQPDPSAAAAASLLLPMRFLRWSGDAMSLGLAPIQETARCH